MEMREKEIIDAAKYALDMHYPDYYKIGGYGDNVVCMEKSSKGWNIYIGERNQKRDPQSYETTLDACLGLFRRVSINGDFANIEAEFIEALIRLSKSEKVA